MYACTFKIRTAINLYFANKRSSSVLFGEMPGAVKRLCLKSTAFSAPLAPLTQSRGQKRNKPYKSSVIYLKVFPFLQHTEPKLSVFNITE